MTSTYKPVFSSNSYKIQINILYNATTTKDDDVVNDDNASNISDSFNNNYYIINNMNDILIEDFIKDENYKYFNQNYNTNDNPIYIINDSYYLDSNVINTIKRNSSAKFPNYNSTIAVKKFEFKKYHEKFYSNTTLKTKYQDELFKIFKDTFIDVINNLRPRKSQESIDEMEDDLENITTYDALFAYNKFINDDAIGSELFHKYIQNIYDTTTSISEKEALQAFYNISYSSLGNKFKYEYFLSLETINNIFKIIQENSIIDQYDRRKSLLNSTQIKEDIYNRYFKYVFPNKKDINNLTDPDKDIILMFYNVYYIIKNIYLLDNTIINVTNFRIKNDSKKENKKYYISHVSLLDLKDNITHFKIEKNKVIIFIKATLKYIIENPILQINYLIDDLENVRQSFLPQSNILLPKDINTNYSSYDKIYIHDKVNYSNNTHEIDSIVVDARKKEFIKNKEELFLNTKALKLFNYFFKRKIQGTSQVDPKIIASNIKFLLYNIFKFYNNKEFKKYYIADTYIQYFTNNSPINQYLSITNGKISKTTEKYDVISSLFSQLSQPQLPSSTPQPNKIYEEIASSDARLVNNIIYKINVVFRCYLDKTGKKPTFVRTLIAEKCLARAQKLDSAFTETLYRTFNLPENYLYNKLANITRKQKANIASANIVPENKMLENKMPENKMPENKMLENKMPENKINPFVQEAIIPNKRGGKITKKYNRSKNITLKHKISDTVKFTNNNIYQ